MKNRHRVAGLLLAGATSTAFVVAGQPAHAAPRFFTIQNFGSGKCIQPLPANSADTGVQLVQEPCTGSAAQHWSPISLGGGNYQFLNQGTGGCMDAHGANVNGTPVDTFPCSGISNQKWNVAPSIPNAVPTRIVSKVSGGSRCLDVSGGSLADGGRIQIYNCTNDNAAQAWLIR